LDRVIVPALRCGGYKHDAQNTKSGGENFLARKLISLLAQLNRQVSGIFLHVLLTCVKKITYINVRKTNLDMIHTVVCVKTQ
jgi:hypothetical protein